MNPTASQLDRVIRCPASAALPQVHTQSEAGDRGTGVHAFIVRAREIGREAALLEIDESESHHELCEQLPLDELPAGGQCELSLAWNMETDSARILGSDRSYESVSPEEYCGTADIAGTKDGRGVIVDWKSGRYVGSPKSSAQLRFLALALSRVADIDEVHASFVYLRDDGTFYRDSAVFDAFDLAGFAETLRALPARVGAARLQVSVGETPDVSTGYWCRYCPAAPACPAKTALAKSFGAELVTVRDRITALSSEDRGKVYVKALEYKDLVEEVIAGLKEVSRVDPTPLPDGRWLREIPVKLATKVDAEVAEEVLVRLHGPDVAGKAIATEKRTTLTAISTALREVAKPGKLAGLERQAIEEIRREGGLKEGTAPQVRITKGE